MLLVISKDVYKRISYSNNWTRWQWGFELNFKKNQIYQSRLFILIRFKVERRTVLSDGNGPNIAVTKLSSLIKSCYLYRI